MQETAKYLCENIQGCSLAYTQSDEISLLLIDYQRFETSAWFDYEIQKMCSISASMATMAFNRLFHKNIANMITKFTSILGDAGINISDMTNKSRGEVAYTMLDVETKPDDDIVEKLRAVNGVFRVRVVK